MDPLSDVLSLLKPRNYACGGVTAGGDWAVRYPKFDGMKCYAIVEGECVVAVDGVKKPVRVERGDCLLLPRGHSFRLGSDAGKTRAVDAAIAYSGMTRYNGILAVTPGDDFFLIGSHFLLDAHADWLLHELPPIVHVRRDVAQSTVRWCVERMMDEVRDAKPGGVLVAQQLAYTMLVQVLRLHLSTGPGRIGWLAGVADAQIGAALGAMHEEPARSWTLRDLAARAGMSRTTFAERFKTIVGSSPMDYLLRWRMQLAADRLRSSDQSISEIARALGYDSESAFGAAFKRVTGISPRRFARSKVTENALDA